MKYKLELVVFLCGAIGMILELIGSRVLSPYFGNSLYVWTNLIGVILGALSLGYYLGGKLSDRDQSPRTLSLIIFTSGIFIALTATIKEPVLDLFSRLLKESIQLSSLISTIILFVPASIALGMISPFAAKIKLNSLNVSGSTVGQLYALSTLGSIIGTFTAGFLLIPHFGNSNLLYLLAISLVIISCLIFFTQRSFVISICLILSLYLIKDNLPILHINAIEDTDSLYNRILVQDWELDDKKVIALRTDNLGAQSLVYVDDPDSLATNYLKYFQLSDLINPQIHKALMVGGGGFSYPRFFLNHHPESLIDVIEIDPKIVQIAQKYFYLKDDPRLKIITADARAYVRNSTDVYDVIFLDAYNGTSIPYQLTTKEFFSDLYHHLTPDGLIVMNLISPKEGPKTAYLQSQIKTISTVFPSTNILSIKDTDPTKVQNLILIASKNQEINLTSLAFEFKYPFKIVPVDSNSPQSLVLTDDHAPVEFLISAMQI